MKLFYETTKCCTASYIMLLLLRYEVTEPEDGKMGSKDTDGSWNGVMGMVQRGVSEKSSNNNLASWYWAMKAIIL